MTSLLSILALGFFLGMRHATDADHVVAVTTIVSRQRSLRGAALIGALWGLGHTLTIVLVGCAIIVFGLVIPARVGLSMELGVALMLVVLGAFNLSGAMRRIDEAAAHAGHDHSAEHAHAHGAERADAGDRGATASTMGNLRSLAVGVVHGLAGSAAVALLVVPSIRDARWAAFYLGVFGLGTVVGMMLLTTAMAAPLQLASRRVRSLPVLMGRLTGAVSLALGLFLVYRIGVTDGLFVGTPVWTPR